jgi:hypothetical protein
MGNSTVKDDFKAYEKGLWKGNSDKTPLPFSAKDLFDDKTMENYFFFVFENLKKPFEQEEIFKKFEVSMNQTNNNSITETHF